MGRKNMGVGSISVTVPLTELKKMEEHMNEHNVSRSRLATLALQNFLNSKTKPNDYIAQQEDYRREIKELKNQSRHYEKEADRLAQNLRAQSNWLKDTEKELHTQKKEFNSERKELRKEINKLNRKLSSIGKILKK